MDLPPNWEQVESEYNKHYDPYEDECPECGAKDCMNYDPENIKSYCSKCGWEEE